MTHKDDILKKMGEDAEENGYFLSPDQELLDILIDGLAVNEDRYGYGACPCRIASGLKTYDSDIECPCEYRDADIAEFGMCYCCLFVSKEVNDDPEKMAPIPERRPVEAQDAAMSAKDRMDRGEHVEVPKSEGHGDMPEEKGRGETLEKEGHKHVQTGTDEKGIPIWRCTVCGYLAARETPPPICPICKVPAEKFVRFGFGA